MLDLLLIHRPLQVNPSISSCNCPVDWTDFSGPFQLILWKKMMHVLYTSEFTTHTHTQRHVQIKNHLLLTNQGVIWLSG